MRMGSPGLLLIMTLLAGCSRAVPLAIQHVSAARAAAAYAAHWRFLGSGMSGPNGLAMDPRGTLYESDYYRGTVTRVSPSGAVSTYAAGFSGPAGLAFDARGNLLVANYENNHLDRIPPGGGKFAMLANAGLQNPVWPAVDHEGRILVADYRHNRLALVDSRGNVSPYLSLPGVNAIAVDSSNRLWVTTWGGTVYRIVNKVPVAIAHGLYSACAIAWSPHYLAVGTYGDEHKANASVVLLNFRGQAYPVAKGLSRTSSVLFDANFNLYAANIGDTALRKYSLK